MTEEKQQLANHFLHKMHLCGLLDGKGHALDIGFGNGNDTLFLATHGYKVDAIEPYSFKVRELQEKIRNLPINIIKSDIQDFVIKKDIYSVIIANNILPFISDKSKVEELINSLVQSLISGGKIYITLFGPKDDWYGKQNMSFFEFEEALAIFEELNLKAYHVCTEEGYGKTMKGDMKFWNIHKFLYLKK